MAGWALAFLGIFGVLAVGLRAFVQYRRTGSPGVTGISGAPGSTEWWGGVLFVVGWTLLVLAAALGSTETLEPIGALDTDLVGGAGVALFWTGLLATLFAQYAMGDSWRIGVEESDRTELVTGGVFGVVRNPIYTGMIPAVIGIALMVPNAMAVAAVVTVVVGLEIQTRLVEEPHLLKVHGLAYAEYAARVGRFLPGVGRLD
jgi:protein-S-isoprenylcysteine O-methyltransferase Ste14